MCILLLIHLTNCETRRIALLSNEVCVYHPMETPPPCEHRLEMQNLNKRNPNSRLPAGLCSSHGACCKLVPRIFCVGADGLCAGSAVTYHAVVEKQDARSFLRWLPDPSVLSYDIDFAEQNHACIREELFDSGAAAWDLVREAQFIKAQMSSARKDGDEKKYEFWEGEDKGAKECFDRIMGSDIKRIVDEWESLSSNGQMEPCPAKASNASQWHEMFQFVDMMDPKLYRITNRDTRGPFHRGGLGDGFSGRNNLVAIPSPSVSSLPTMPESPSTGAKEIDSFEDVKRALLAVNNKLLHILENTRGISDLEEDMWDLRERVAEIGDRQKEAAASPARKRRMPIPPVRDLMDQCGSAGLLQPINSERHPQFTECAAFVPPPPGVGQPRLNGFHEGSHPWQKDHLGTSFNLPGGRTLSKQSLEPLTSVAPVHYLPPFHQAASPVINRASTTPARPRRNAPPPIHLPQSSIPITSMRGPFTPELQMIKVSAPPGAPKKGVAAGIRATPWEPDSPCPLPNERGNLRSASRLNRGAGQLPEFLDYRG